MLEALLACRTQDELRRAVDAYVKRLGFKFWVYAATPNGQNAFPFVMSTYPTAWMARYIERGYLDIDPVVTHCREHSTPLIWTSDGVVGNRVQQCAEFFHDAADFGLRSGISLPVHGLECAWGLLSLAGQEEKNGDSGLRPLASAHLLTAFTHEVGHRFAINAQTNMDIHLTKRELECLRWTASGKTGWEIGRLLSISERTVMFHLENAARKLHVFGRRHAVVRAIALKLINL